MTLYYITCDALDDWIPVVGTLDRAKKRAAMDFQYFGTARGVLQVAELIDGELVPVATKSFNTKWESLAGAHRQSPAHLP